MSFLRILPSRAATVLLWLCIAAAILVTTSKVRSYGSSDGPLDPAALLAALETRNCSRVKSSPPNTIDSVGLASALSPADLLCRDRPSNSAAIPKLFHQSWKSSHLPAKFERWSNSCRKQHPDWEWVLWTDQDNIRLVKEHFPWLMETYLNLPGKIYRVDFARNLYMHLFGGVYADLDTECLRPTSEGLQEYGVVFSDASHPPKEKKPQKKKAFFGRMGTDDTFESGIPNAWMAASPGHPFFLLPLESAAAEVSTSRSALSWLWHPNPSAEQLTGPVALRKSILKYQSEKREDDVVLLPEYSVYPFNWNTGNDLRAVCSAEQQSFDELKCKTTLDVDAKGSMSITYWSHTHRGKGADAKNIENVSHD